MVLRKFIVVVGVVAGLLGLVQPVSAAAAVAASCYGNSCNGLEPEKSGCSDDARTVRSREVDSFDVELRYSPDCHAVWTRITNNSGYPGVAKVIGYYNGEFRRQELRTLAAYEDEVAWTKMLTSTYLTYACLRRYVDYVGWDEWCTAGH
jgi:hypothetical protein